MKTTRNNLQAHRLHIENEIVDWADILKLYHSTHEMRLRLAPKLTERHIYQKPFSNMKVKRATQVLSASVCVALLALVYAKQLPEAAMSTAYFCDRMDKLFDCLNSSSPKKTEQKLRHAIRKGQPDLVEFLGKQLPWIASWKFEGKRQPHTIIGWQITIKAVLLLWEDVSQNYDFEFLLTRRLQQDPLEQMFGHIRQKQGCNSNPNVPQFISGLKHIGIQKLLTLSPKGNVEEDETDLLQELSPFSLSSESLVDVVQHVPQDDFPSLENITELAAHEESHVIDNSATYYVAGFIVKMFTEKAAEGCCCPDLLRDEHSNLDEPHQFFMMLKAYHVPGKLFGNLTVPLSAAFTLVQQLESIFLSVIESVAHLRSVCETLYITLSRVGDFNFCTPECRARFLKMFCRIRLCWHVRFVNRNLDKVRFHSRVSGVQLEKFSG